MYKHVRLQLKSLFLSFIIGCNSLCSYPDRKRNLPDMGQLVGYGSKKSIVSKVGLTEVGNVCFS